MLCCVLCAAITKRKPQMRWAVAASGLKDWFTRQSQCMWCACALFLCVCARLWDRFKYVHSFILFTYISRYTNVFVLVCKCFWVFHFVYMYVVLCAVCCLFSGAVHRMAIPRSYWHHEKEPPNALSCCCERAQRLIYKMKWVHVHVHVYVRVFVVDWLFDSLISDWLIRFIYLLC